MFFFFSSNFWTWGVSKNNGTPKSSILKGFSIINHPFWGTPIFRNIHMSRDLLKKGTTHTMHVSNEKKGPWLFSVYRGLYYPVVKGL